MVKALVLLSGGLDSMLAAKVLMEQGIEVTGLSFKSYFFDTAKARKAAEQLGIELIEVDFSDEHLTIVKNPKYGYGKNMNPCIDCHILMLKKAREMMEGNPPLHPPLSGGKYDFVATGEVLGERPMSQNLEALKLIERITGLAGRLIRPLSAKLLVETDAEKIGQVKRHKLLDISGRSRKPQFELLKKYGVKEYQGPGGGCLLTDPVFSEKLMKILEYWPAVAGVDIELLKYGRVYWLNLANRKKVILVVGREENDNKNLLSFAKISDILIETRELAGPVSLIRGIEDKELEAEEITIQVPEELKMSELKLGEKKTEAEIIKVASLLTGYYATKARGKKVRVEVKII